MIRPFLILQGILTHLEKMAKDERLKTVDSFGLAVLSHGDNNDTVFGTDGEALKALEIFNKFDPTERHSLAGKPKLFIINACRGGKKY